MAANLVAKVIRHRAPAADLALAHAVPRDKVHADPDPVYGNQGRHGHKTIYQGGVQVGDSSPITAMLS
jgi:hypothetical protein